MSLFSSLRKNKQESASDDGAFYSRAEEDSKAVRNRSRRRQGGARDAAADPVLPEKKRARRRLIGAVALVLATVIGLPMLLDAEPQPLADDIAIRIPSKDKVPPLESERPADIDAVLPPGGAEELAEATAPSANQQPSGTASSAKAGEAVANKSADSDASKAHGKANTVAQAPESAKTDAKAAERSDDAARAKALLEGKPDPKNAADEKGGKFVIQVAALASKAKVDELQSRLKQSGIKSYTQTVATRSGERTRIRVGPFPSKEEAEKVRARIVKLGLGGTVVPA